MTNIKMMMNNYTVLSKFYEKLAYDIDKNMWARYIIDIISNTNTNARFGVDAGCGNGLLTLLLAEKYDMIGFDSSTQMLTEAVKNRDKSRHKPNFILANLENFVLTKKQDFATIVNDAINYVPPSKIFKVFSNFYKSLAKGGILLFDINTEYKLKNVYGNNVYFDDDDTLTLLWQNKLNTDSVDFELILFERQKDCLYQKFEETHTQYMYSIETIQESLKKAGFTTVSFFELFTNNTVTDSCEEIQFVAIK